MKALVWEGPQKLVFKEKEMPKHDKQIRIKVSHVGICGSDLGVYLGVHPRAKAPLVMGHEFSGVIEAIPDGLDTTLHTGDRVVVNPSYSCGKCNACLEGNSHVCNNLRMYGVDRDGGMAEYVSADADNVYKIPDGMPMDIAAVVEPVAVVLHGLRMVKRDYYTHVCVTGMGPIGLLTALVLKSSDAKKVYGVETDPTRIEFAKKLGIEVIDGKTSDVKEYIKGETNGEGVDLLIEATGSPAVAKMMTDLVAVRGEILILSVFKRLAEVDLHSVNFKEQVMIGTRIYTRRDFKDAIHYAAENIEKIKSVISDEILLSDGLAAFEKLIGGNANMMKVLLKIN